MKLKLLVVPMPKPFKAQFEFIAKLMLFDNLFHTHLPIREMNLCCGYVPL